MAKVKFELNLPGLNELMKSEPMKEVLLDAAKQVASNAGEGYKAGVHTGYWIGIANVYPETKEASRNNLENNVLLKALGSVGLRMKK